SSNPLLERVKFISIVASNLDEFFMVRVAGLLRQVRTGVQTRDEAGLTPRQQIDRIHKRVREIVSEQYRCLHEELLPALDAEGISFRHAGTYSGTQTSFLKERFREEIFPVLTPVRVESDGPLPVPGNLRLHVAFRLRPKEDAAAAVGSPARGGSAGTDGAAEELVSVVQIPPSLDRIVAMPASEGTPGYTFLEDVIVHHAEALFPGYEILESAPFRITRDADLGVDEARDEDFLEAMEQVLESRRHSAAVRLTITQSDGTLREFLREKLAIGEEQLYTVPGPLDLSSLMSLLELRGYAHLRDERWTPRWPAAFTEEEELWDVLKRQDVLIHQPYESFEPVARLVQDAARDPGVLAIKMTLYRTSGDSPIVRALEEAAENGKQVMALVELKARFDEERNIQWSQRLERAGVIVVYGIAQLKVHAKALMIIRREPEGVVRYIHMGTGNYNDKTAKLYTDMGLFTTNRDIAYEVGLFFNAITGYSAIPALTKICISPTAMKGRIIQLIEREAMRSAPDDPGLIMAKMNSLSHPEVVEALYRASRQGVRIRLNVRGICMLVPGIAGQSENIEVVSIVDRFLEHSRMFYFRNGGAEEVYLSSADWMPRNLDRRVELMFPLQNRSLLKRGRQILEAYFRDNVKARELQPDGTYLRRAPDGKEPFRVQEYFAEEARRAATADEPANRKEFNVRRKPPSA
ncbi:MAG: polyphosphate kinase 1, partial [Spirochaetota bacterium]